MARYGDDDRLQLGSVHCCTCGPGAATWFGYPTVWVNRLGAPSEVLDAAVAVMGRGLDVLLDLVGA